ncbi:3-keto-5-aminohexanoate cleavage protein [Desulfoferula mesophila]|uniref:3-keto-5-aminohexanoate cleavage protein n=1 Tax=Desulfoferula mesophila TaxID=3058419 RepID=A0AAU9EL66_9BACT|nr:3-keto-5-aminohexanoate cleavage protein [Desulfoferula mesophilus]
MEKLIITAAITGGASPDSNPNLPKTPAEQAQATIDVYNAGASVVHIHARNPETGRGEQRSEWLEQAILPIREKTDIIVNVSTGGSGRRCDGDHLYEKMPLESVEGRLAVVPELCKNPAAAPELASFNAGSPVIDIYSASKKDYMLKFVMVHSFPDMVHMAETMKSCGVKPELECYDVGMINNAVHLAELGHLEEPMYFQFVLGVLGQIPATPENLLHMVHCLPKGSPWSVCAIGLNEFRMAAMSMIMGGHVRVGFEDNLYLSPGVMAKSNAELVEKAVRMARELGREIATPEEARQILGLPPRK